MCILIRYISDHDSRSTIIDYIFQIDDIGFRLLVCYGSTVSDSWAFHHVVVVFLRDHMHHGMVGRHHLVVCGGVGVGSEPG